MLHNELLFLPINDSTELRQSHFKCCQLLHQYIVDMYAKIDTKRLMFIRFNQTFLPSEEYVLLRDAVVDYCNTTYTGRLTMFHLHALAVHVICMSMLKVQWHIIVTTRVQPYALHSHVIQLWKTYNISYFMSNYQWISLTSQHVLTDISRHHCWISL